MKLLLLLCDRSFSKKENKRRFFEYILYTTHNCILRLYSKVDCFSSKFVEFLFLKSRLTQYGRLCFNDLVDGSSCSGIFGPAQVHPVVAASRLLEIQQDTKRDKTN